LTSHKINIQKNAFFEAVKRGRYEIAKELIRALEEYGGEIENGEEPWDKWVVEKTDEHENNSLKLAIMHGWVIINKKQTPLVNYNLYCKIY
jgi:hypothetical protein